MVRRLSSWKLDFAALAQDNYSMDISGLIQNGVVVLDGAVTLPEGTRVTVSVVSKPVIHVSKNKKRVELPLIRSSAPGSIHLTNERIQEILDDEDIEALKRTWNEPS